MENREARTKGQIERRDKERREKIWRKKRIDGNLRDEMEMGGVGKTKI